MKKYSIIYTDNPWEYRVWSKKGQGRSAESHYPCMSIEDMCALPVSDLAADDCALFMWVTFPLLREAFTVLDAWSFQYKTCAFTWIKQNKKSPTLFWGMGHWTRANAEICWRRGDIRSAFQPVYIRWSCPRLSITAKNRMKSATGLLSLWAICPA